MKKFLLFIVCIACYAIGSSQDITNYAFSSSTGTYTPISGTVSTATGDDGYENVDLPFTFIYMGVPYTSIRVSTNGVVLFGATATPSYTNNLDGTTSTYKPVAAPLWDDLYDIETSEVRYATSGTSPNQVFTVEWANMPWNRSTGTPQNFQLKLYETTGVIEFVYGAMQAPLNTPSASIGINDQTGGSGHFLSVTPGSTPTVSSTVENSTINDVTYLTSGLTYTFTPPAAPAAPTNLTFSDITAVGMTLNWTDNASTESGYSIFRSDDGGSNYNLIATTAADAVSYVASGLLPSTTYYWKVYAVNEGAISSELAGSQATNAPGAKISAATGNWSESNTWSPVGVPTAGDNVTIADGDSVTIDIDAFCNSLTVGQGATTLLRYEEGSTNRTLTVANGVVVSANAVFDAGNPGAARTHILNIGGNDNNSLGTGSLTVDGTFDMYVSSNGKAYTYFYGNQDATLTGSGATCDFYTVYLKKGTVTASKTVNPPMLDVQRPFTYQNDGTAFGPFYASGSTTGIIGLLKISGTFTQSSPLFISATSNYITATGGIWLDNPNFTVEGQTDYFYVYGLLKVTDGTFNIGTTTSYYTNWYSGATVVIEGGAVNCASAFKPSSTLSSYYVNYYQSGGTLTVGTAGGYNSTSYAMFDMGVNSSTVFEMSGGTIVVQSSNPSGTPRDVRGAAFDATTNITGGTIQLGNASTSALSTFYIEGTLPSLTINNTFSHTGALRGDAIIYDINIPTGPVLNCSTYVCTVKGDIDNGEITADAASLVFSGAAAQTVEAGATFTSSQINSLTIDNSSGVTITPAVQINGSLDLVNGNLDFASLTLGTGAAGTFNLTRGEGGVISTPSFNYNNMTVNYTYNGTNPQTTGNELPASVSGTLTINNASGVTLNAALDAGVLAMTSGDLTTTAANLLTITGSTEGAVTGGSASSYVNGPLARTLPASLATGTTYSFPIGKGSYNLYEMIDATVDAGGDIVVTAEVFDADCGGTPGTGFSALNTDRYWYATYAGSGSLTGTKIKLTDASADGSKTIGRSATQSGTYNSIGGSYLGGALTSKNTTNLDYFVIGTKAPLAGGTYYVGPTGDYLNLTEVAAELNSSILSGDVIFELQSTYTSAGETFPIGFNQFGTSGGSWSVIVRPATGATGLITQGDGGDGTPLINFNGTDRITFDGRPGGSGSSEWTFRNTRSVATIGPAFQFINDATNNTLTYLTIEGQCDVVASGTILFSTTSGTTGNDDNTISYCDIRDRSDASGTPINAIRSEGTAGKENSGITITANNIYNFFSATDGAEGISIESNTTGWTITNNHFYQTATRLATNVTEKYHIGIDINTGDGYTITGNYIGGSAPSAGGTAWTLTDGAANNRFLGIWLGLGSTTVTSVQNNTVTNINLTTSSGTATGDGVFTGISLYTGWANIGNTAGNKVGSISANNQIVVTTTTSGALINGILSQSTETVNISNNQVGGITGTGDAAIGYTIKGISTSGTAGNYTIQSNTIGSTSQAHSICAGASGTTTAACYVYGIDNAATGTIGIQSNTISNLTSYGANVAGQVIGVRNTGGVPTLSGNSITSLTSAATNAGTGGSACVVGIYQSSTTAGSYTVGQNIIHSLVATDVSANTGITGMYYSGPTSGTHAIARNFVHSFNTSTVGTGASMTGIYIGGGASLYKNNMVRLGIDPEGSDIAADITIIGIQEATTASNNIFHNSVYIGGGGMESSTSNTFAMYRSSTGTDSLVNNIFVNNRSNTSGTGEHYCINVSSTTDLESNYNVFYATGTGGKIGLHDVTSCATFADWKSSTSVDANSAAGNPAYENPTGAAGDLDLHINMETPTPVEGVSNALASVTDDYDGETRDDSGPTDIGADAGEFMPKDLTPPSISYTALGTSTGLVSRTLSNVAITDVSNVNVDGGTAPRIYFKEKGDANDFVGNTSGDNGWKWIESPTGSTPFEFTMLYSMIFGGSVSPGDTIQYFVVAQDESDDINVGTYNAAFAVKPTSVDLEASAFPIGGSIDEYAILQSFSGNYDVGTTGDYATLNAAIAAIQSGVVTGAVTLTLIDATYPSETFPIEINELTGVSAVNTVTIKPGTGVDATISGSSGASYNALIKLNGADYIIIDGSNNGTTSRNLTISNTSTSTYTPVIWVSSLGTGAGATNNTIKNCIISGGTNTITSSFGIYVAGTSVSTVGTGADNDNLTIENNAINTAYYGIFARGGSSSNTLEGLVIKDNSIGGDNTGTYITAYGISLRYATGPSITGNDIFNIISNNYKYGMYFYDYVSDAVISRNKIHGFNQMDTYSDYCYGIYFYQDEGNSNNQIDHNLIYDLYGYGSTYAYYGPVGIGFYYGGDSIKILYNSISLTAAFGSSSTGVYSHCVYIRSNGITNLTMQNNILSNTMTGSTPRNYTVYSVSGTTFLSSDYNDFYTTGAAMGYFVSEQTALSDWQAATSQDANSISTAPQLNSETNLQPLLGSPVLAAGTPVAGITTDYLGVARDGSTPSIGAFEEGVDGTGPTISYTALGNTALTSDRVLTGFATITDVSGVNTTAGTKPRIYYKRSTDNNEFNDNTNTTNGWKYTEATNSTSPFDFTINYGLLNGGTGVSVGDVVEYFVVAQDLLGTPNVSIESGTFAVAPSSVALGASAFPIGGTINSYMISQAFTGTINVGSGETYTSLTGDDAGGLFKAINSGVLTGNVTVSVTSDLTETGAISLNEWSEEGAGPFTLTIVPSAATLRLISGSNDDGLITLYGADRVTFDGNFGGSGRYLRIYNTSTSTTTAAIHIASLGAGAGATNNTIKNCIISGGGPAYSSSIAVYVGGTTVSTSSGDADNDNLTIENNSINSAAYGIYAEGTPTGMLDGLVIKDNSIGSDDPGLYISAYGMRLEAAAGASITGNDIFNMKYDGNRYGMYLYSYISDAVISKNKIHGFDQAGGTSTFRYCYGIYFYDDLGMSNNQIDNNLIYDLSNYGSTSAYYGPVGIGFYYGGDGFKLYYNSISLTGAFESTSSGVYSICVYNRSSSPGLTNFTMENNILYNAMTGTSPNNYTIYLMSGTTFSSSNYNDFYSTGAAMGYFGAEVTALSDWQTATSQDANSLSVDPQFNSTTMLMPQTGSSVLAAGTPVTGLTTDFKGDTRDGVNPSIGAYENGGDGAPPAISYTVLKSTANLGNRTLANVTITDASGVNTTSGTKPRIYYKKSTDADAFVGNGSGDNGWKWTETAGSASPFSFTIDYSIINGGSVSVGDEIQYFVVAQDLYATPNVGSEPAGGFEATSVSSITSTPSAPNSYNIIEPMSGTYTVGTGGNYLTLTGTGGLFEAINSDGLKGDVTATIISDITEPGTVALNEWNESGGSGYTVTIAPNSAVTRNLTGDLADGLIRLDGADRVIFDGRFSGSGMYLSFNNDNTGGNTFLFINDATNNTIRNCDIKGTNTSTSTSSAGVIRFGGTTGSTGNDHNTITACNIHDGISNPRYLIFAYGTSGMDNDSNTVSDNNIYNFWAASSYARGIYVYSYNSDWTISGNSFYQTASMTSGYTYAIYMYNSSASFTVTGNYIGGSAPNCGGTAWTVDNAYANRFYGIYMYTSTSSTSSVQGNTIQNIYIGTTSSGTTTSAPFLGIYAYGTMDVGTIAGNTIGSGTGTGSINIVSDATVDGGEVYGIYASRALSTVTIENNTIGSINFSHATPSSGIAGEFFGIYVSSSGTRTISSNVIGSTTQANSINNAMGEGETSTTDRYTVGIYSYSTGDVTISGNTVANMAYTADGEDMRVMGIRTCYGSSSTANIITGNTVRNLTSASQEAETASDAAVMGIVHDYSTYGCTISGNTVHSLASTHATAAVEVNGIVYYGTTSTTNVIDGNFVHSLNMSTSSTSAAMNGIVVQYGAATVSNNMVRLGIDAGGADITTEYAITGISKLTTADNNFYHNSVYIGGSGVGTTATNTFAINRAATGTDDIRNNLFVNNRSNATTGGTHYAIGINGTTSLTLDYNLYYTNGTGGSVGLNGAAGCATLADWQTSTSLDGNSMYADPQYIAPAGDAATVNLHIHATNPTPLEGSGTAIAGITLDYDGQTRSGLTPVDIGADAGNFVFLDMVDPDISYTAIANSSQTSTLTLTDFATITDVSGVNTTPGTKPRIYYKKSTDNNTYVDNTSGTNGWKYVEASDAASAFDFTINYSLIFGGTVSNGDVIQYFVVAQDNATTPNVGINSGTFATEPASVDLQLGNFAIGGTINDYTIVTSYSGTINVGTGETYTSLTADAADGLFKTINNGTVSGDLTINITSDLTETGAIALNEWVEEGAGNWTMTIQSDGAVLRTISGTAVASGTPMINFSGSDRVTINGAAGKYLTFRNTNADPAVTGATITFDNGSVSCTLTNATIENNGTSSLRGAIVIGAGTNNVTISNSDIRDATAGTTGSPAIAVNSLATDNTLTIQDNNIFNWQSTSGTGYGIYCNSVADNATITGNSFYFNLGTKPTTDQTAIYVASGNGHTITGNYIGGSAASCGGAAWENSGTTIQFTGIYLNTGSTSTTTVGSNTISNISLTGTINPAFTGIQLDGASDITVEKNTINTCGPTAASPGTADIIGILAGGASGGTGTIQNNAIALGVDNNDHVYKGIDNNGASGYDVFAYYNSINIYGTASGSQNSYAIVKGGAANQTNTNNVLVNARTGGTGKHYAIAVTNTGGTINSNYNNFNSGTTLTNWNSTDYNTLADWQTNSGGDASSINAASCYTSLTNLESDTTNANWWYINGTGLPVVGISTDILGNARSTSIVDGPVDMGAYEFDSPVLTDPPVAVETGTLAAGNSTNYFVGGRKICQIDWISGTVPTGITFKYYSGTHPSDYGNNPEDTFALAYWDITPAGGAGYTYDITFFYDDSYLYLSAPVETDVRIGKSDNNGASWWIANEIGTGVGECLHDDAGNTMKVHGLTSFSRFALMDMTEDHPLPIELLSFTSNCVDDGIELNWSTASEKNNDYFVVERSADGITFEPVAQIKGAGNSSQVLDYSFVDKQAYEGSNYYRLKQVDYDAKYTYSAIIAPRCNNYTNGITIDKVYQNSSSNCTVEIYSLDNGKAIVSVYNYAGQKLLLHFAELQKGDNKIEIPVSGLATGIYFVKVESNRFMATEKFYVEK